MCSKIAWVVRMATDIDDDRVTSTNINELVEMKIGFNGIDAV